MLSERIIWLEGMSVSPIHFQQQDQYVDMQVHMQGKLLFSYAWGLTELVLAEQYLSLGKVVIEKAKGIMPDGTLFEIGHGNLQPISLDITPGITNKRIMLTLPLNIEGTSATRESSNTTLATRYIQAERTLRDHNFYVDKSSNELSVFCAQLDLQLMVEGDIDDRHYISLPILHVLECRQDGTIIIDEKFYPPYLHAKASPALNAYLDEVIGLIGHRADHLAERLSSGAQAGTAEAGDFMLLQCLNRVEPILRHMEKLPTLHPEVLFRVLISLVGELSTFSERNKRPGSFTEYNHEKQFYCFTKIMEQVRYVLSTVLEQHAMRLPLQQRKSNVQVAFLHDKTLLESGVFILTAKADMPQDTLRLLLPKQIKIGTPENIRELVNTHLPGIKLFALAVAPRQIPYHAGRSYFRLDFSPQQLAQTEASTGCALHVSGAFPGLELELWAIKE